MLGICTNSRFLVIEEQAAIAASIESIHIHHVKRGLCKPAVDFKWSSARFFHSDHLDSDLPSIRKADPEWFHTSGVSFE